MSPRGEESPAIVLRTHPMRESDLVVVLLGREWGQRSCAARGARKSRRRFPGGLPVGARGDARVAQGRGSLANLEAFAATSDHSALGRDLEAFAFVNYACELTERLTVEQHPEPRVFDALWALIETTTTMGPDPMALRAYEIRLLGELGFLPDLDVCAVCGDAVGAGDSLPFDATRGGVLCLRHGAAAPRRARDILQLAASLRGEAGGGGLGAMGEDPSLNPEMRRTLRDLTQAWIRPHLSRPLRSTQLFRDLRRVSSRAAAAAAGLAEPGPGADPDSTEG